MKTNSSSYILAAEIITIILFHAVKIKQAEKHPAEMVYSRITPSISIKQPAVEKKPAAEYMLVNLVK